MVQSALQSGARASVESSAALAELLSAEHPADVSTLDAAGNAIDVGASNSEKGKRGVAVDSST